jgi:hypothetical protein
LLWVVKVAHIVTAGELLDGHSALDIECLDRIYLNAYVPILQSSGQVVAFMTQYLGKPIPSPALMEQIGTRFRRSVESYASCNGIPWVKFGKGDRKIDVMQPHIAAQAATGRSGVAAVGVSQEFQRVWSAYQRDTQTAAPQYTFAKADRRVTCYYFYLWDEDSGPYADRPVMPRRVGLAWSLAFRVAWRGIECVLAGGGQRVSRKASRLSGGVYRPGGVPSGASLDRACCLSAMSACR